MLPLYSNNAVCSCYWSDNSSSPKKWKDLLLPLDHYLDSFSESLYLISALAFVTLFNSVWFYPGRASEASEAHFGFRLGIRYNQHSHDPKKFSQGCSIFMKNFFREKSI